MAGGYIFDSFTFGRVDHISTHIVFVAYLAVAALLVLMSRHDPLALATFAVLAAATVAIAWRAEAATAAVPAAAVLVVLVFVRWAADLDIERLVMPSGPVAGAVPEPPKTNAGWHLVLGAAFALLFGGAGYLAHGRSERPLVPVLWSATAVFAPIAILAALYYRIARFEPSIPFAAAALLLSVLYAFATETLDKRAPRPGFPAASADAVSLYSSARKSQERKSSFPAADAATSPIFIAHRKTSSPATHTLPNLH